MKNTIRPLWQKWQKIVKARVDPDPIEVKIKSAVAGLNSALGRYVREQTDRRARLTPLNRSAYAIGVKLFNIYLAEPSRSGISARCIGQVEARSEKAVLAAIKKLKLDSDGMKLFARDAALDPWRRPQEA